MIFPNTGGKSGYEKEETDRGTAGSGGDFVPDRLPGEGESRSAIVTGVMTGSRDCAQQCVLTPTGASLPSLGALGRLHPERGK